MEELNAHNNQSKKAMNHSTLTKICILLFTIGSSFASAQSREWTRLDGKTLNAQLQEATKTEAMLKLAGGSVYKIPITQLSLDDQQYIATWLKKRKQPDLKASPGPAMTKVTPTGPADQKGRTVKVEATTIENPKVREEKGFDPENKLYLIEGDATHGSLELTFPNNLFDSTFISVKSLTLVMQVANTSTSQTEHQIVVLQGREELGFKNGARKKELIKIPLEPAKFKNRSRIQLEVECGGDAVVLLRKPAPHLIAVFSE